jgi:putative cardiolipin synthase
MKRLAPAAPTVLRLLLVVVALSILGGCASLPADYPRTETHALQDTGSTRLGQAGAAALAAHPGQNGFLPLPSGVDALVMRLHLAEQAERSLDLMYYIWHNDLVGRHMVNAVLRAADRGVRVRILLDDLGVAADDAHLLALDAHPNIEIRLFNPIALRGLRGWGTLVDFGRLNRRMHDKAFIADNQRAVLGGRNIGDEYFGANSEVAFGDLDVAFAGPLVADVSAVFDQFWNSPVVYPIAALAGQPGDAASLDALRASLAGFVASQRDSPYVTDLKAQAVAMRAASADQPFWGQGHVLADDPLKVTRPPEDAQGHLLPKFATLGLQVQRELLIVSPYFVPGDSGVAWLTGLVKRGARVTVLTNSLASNDVAAVHAGYRRYREALLEGGVRLYELRPQAVEVGREKTKGGLMGSRASLHAKTFMVDRKAIFIGSLNLDPRSIQLNTEIGVVCENAAMVATLASGLESALDRIAWRVERGVDASGKPKLVWVETGPEGVVRRAEEPDAGFWRRLSVWFIGLLPVESQL